MPLLERGATTIYYEETGDGFPVFLIAPGGMLSSIDLWKRASINPLVEFAGDFRLVAMDQRNAGASSGPLDVDDPWGSYVEDQLAVLDHLGIESCHMIGCCIGGSYILKLLERAPSRVVAAVLEQPIGLSSDNFALFDAMWRSWAAELVVHRPDIDAALVERFGTKMWEGDFVVSVGRQFIGACPTPLLVLPGTDEYHPGAAGREVAALAPRAQSFEPWKGTPEDLARGIERDPSLLGRAHPAIVVESGNGH